MLKKLKIDPEFQSKIPPLTFHERNQLETNILEEGRILHPLIVWNGIIVDGHTRYAILKPLCYLKAASRNPIHHSGKGLCKPP